jgi:hypothetical protein
MLYEMEIKVLSKLKRIVVPVVLAATLSGCSLSYYRHTSNADYQATDGSDVNVSMSLHGEMRVNPEETEILYLAPGSKINVSSRVATDRQRLVLRGLADGEVGTEYEVNGAPVEFDDEAKAFLASVVPILYSQSGVNIPERIERLYRVGGESLVLERVAPINSDFNQGRYLTYLFENKPLSDQAIETSISLLSNIQSDFELSKVMRAMASNQPLSQGHWMKFLEQSKTIGSDFEMSKLFISLKKTDLPANVLSELSYVSAGYIQSDFEQAKVLKALVKDRQYGDQQWLDFLDSSKAIQSDSELSRVLKEILDNEVNETVLLGIIDITQSHLSSSYSKADVLTKLVKRNEVTLALKRALLTAIDDVNSDSEQNKLLKLLAA